MPSPKKLLVVLGATGAQGSAVVTHFLTHPSLSSTYRVRGTTRNTSSPAAQALLQRHPQDFSLVRADANDLASLKAAFAGASAIFAYTDVAGCMQSAQAQKLLADKEVEDLVHAAGRVEAQQGRNIADAAAGMAGLERLVWSSLTDVKRWSRGKYKNAVHFDTKAEVWEYMKRLPGLEGKASAVVMGTFVDNILRLPGPWKMEKEADGKYLYQYPMNAKTVIPYVDAQRDTGAFVQALIKAPGGLQILGVSENLTSEQWMVLWAEHQGVKARFEKVLPETLLRDNFMGLGQALADVFQFVDEFGYTGGDEEILTPEEFESKTGVKIARTKIVDHIQREDWSPVM